MTGAIDIHSHLLPGLDDGPGTMPDALAMAQAAGDLGGGGAGREGDGVALGDHLGGGQGDAALLVGEAFLAEGEGGVEAERLIGQLAGQFDPAMGAMHEAATLELDEIATDAGRRGIDGGSEVVDAAGSFLQEQMKDLIGTIMRLRSHLEGSFLGSTTIPCADLMSIYLIIW